jgi:TolB-like protein
MNGFAGATLPVQLPGRLQKVWSFHGDFVGFAAGLVYARAVIYRFGEFELDLARAELRAGGAARPLEPQVFALLVHLVQNRDRLVSRDELLEKVWDGRVVSDAAVASRIKSARRALGDDGTSQRCIRTAHRQGFRFVAPVKMLQAGYVEYGEPTAPPPGPLRDEASRPSIAVLPFRLLGDAGPHAAVAEAIPDELIVDLARLRWLFVTARGSSFRLRASDADMGEIGRLLGVRYCLTGTVEVLGKTLAVGVELVDTRDARIVWAERFAGSLDDVHRVREEMRARVLAALEIRIPMHEASLARLGVTENLDAWSAYHLGLQHMYRFNRRDNAQARALFQRAVASDSDFARAHAGLSFVHFQTAFLHITDDLAGEVGEARRFAARALELDAMDPFVNFVMGRTYWLTGDLGSALPWLERATALSPNYAQGIYARAWTETLAGNALDGHTHADLAMRLSPLDPLFYGMLGTRAFAHLVLGEAALAARWAERAARAPGAHVLIAMIAAAMHSIAGDEAASAGWAANVRERNPALRRDDFFRSFPMKSAAARGLLEAALARRGF